MPRTRHVTAEEFAALGEGRRELIYGEVVEMTPACSEHGQIGAHFVRHLLNFVAPRSLGAVHNSDAGFLLEKDPDLVREPDVSFVAAERLVGLDPHKFLPLAPDLAVEVVSPDDSAREVDEKAKMWIGHGSRLVWVVDPKHRRVFVYRPGHPRAELAPGEDLFGEDVLPGFTLPVADCF